MESKLNLNRNLVDKARESARRIAEDPLNFIALHTTVTVERAVCRLLGIDGDGSGKLRSLFPERGSDHSDG